MSGLTSAHYHHGRSAGSNLPVQTQWCWVEIGQAGAEMMFLIMEHLSHSWDVPSVAKIHFNICVSSDRTGWGGGGWWKPNTAVLCTNKQHRSLVVKAALIIWLSRCHQLIFILANSLRLQSAASTWFHFWWFLIKEPGAAVSSEGCCVGGNSIENSRHPWDWCLIYCCNKCSFHPRLKQQQHGNNVSDNINKNDTEVDGNITDMRDSSSPVTLEQKNPRHNSYWCVFSVVFLLFCAFESFWILPPTVIKNVLYCDFCHSS